MNWEKVTNDICSWMRHILRKSGMEKFIVGMSGGVDSSVCAALSCRAVGPRNVIGVAMPYDKETYTDNNRTSTHTEDARNVAALLGIPFFTIPIGPTVDSLRFTLNKTFPTEEKLRRKYEGNIRSRIRMVVLYDIAARNRGLVVGTGNLTEDYIGYQTKWGDSACDLFPIGSLVKREVRELARYLGLPEWVASKVATAALEPGQTDEEDLSTMAGFPVTYDDIDEYLRTRKNTETGRKDQNEPGEEKRDPLAEFVEELFKKNEHKLTAPPRFPFSPEDYP